MYETLVQTAYRKRSALALIFLCAIVVGFFLLNPTEVHGQTVSSNSGNLVISGLTDNGDNGIVVYNTNSETRVATYRPGEGAGLIWFGNTLTITPSFSTQDRIIVFVHSFISNFNATTKTNAITPGAGSWDNWRQNYGFLLANAGCFNMGTSAPCVAPVLGCTDPAANNYNPAANTEDNSCTYNPNGNTTTSGTSSPEVTFLEYQYPLQLGEETNVAYGLRGLILSAPNTEGLPLSLTFPALLKKLKVNVGLSYGNLSSQELVPFIRVNGIFTNCTAQAGLTGDDYNVPTETFAGEKVATEVTFVFTGTGCSLPANASIDVLLPLAGTGYYALSKQDAGNGSFAAIGNADSRFSYNTATVPDEDKYVNILEPTQDLMSSTSVSIAVQFSTAPTFDYIPAYITRYEILDALTQEIQFQYEERFEERTAVNYTVTDTIDLPDGSKIIRAYFTDNDGKVISEIDERFFNVNINSYQQSTGVSSPYQNTANLTQNDCQLFEIGCQFQKALLFLFKPTEASFSSLKNLQSNISQRVPFAYYYEAKAKLEGIDNGAGSLANLTVSAGMLGNVTLVNWAHASSGFGGQEIATFSTYIVYGLWFFFLIWCYRRVIQLWGAQE